LRRVGEEQDPPRSEQRTDGGQGLQRADLVVRRHHRHEHGVGTQRACNGPGLDDAIRARSDEAQFPAFGSELLHHAEHGLVLDRGRQDMAPRARRV
jgi:hypothetical protein